MDKSILQLIEKTRSIGTWNYTPATGSLQWSDATYAIHEEDPSKAVELGDGINYYVPEHRPIIEACVESSLHDRTPWDVELQIRTAKGRLRWVRAIGEPIYADDKLLRLQGVFEDINERKTLEVERESLLTRIEELNRRLVLALEASQVGVWEWNIKTDELIWDAHMYELYGIEEGSFSGAYEAWEQGLHPEDRQRAVDEIQRALCERKRFDATFRVVWPNGTVRTIKGAAEAVLDSDGEPERLIGVNWDVTHFIRTQRELERSNEELAQFAYRTSHDLKSPLTAIRRLAQYMGQDLDDGDLDAMADNVVAIEQRANAMESMVAGILETAKADLSTTIPEPIDLDEILTEVTETLRLESSESGVKLSWTVDVDDRPTLPRGRIHQVLLNLVGNGIKYSSPLREQKLVAIKATSYDGQLNISVTDNGTGIPTVEGRTPYEMFTRLHADVSGSGLGLYIVQKHVVAMGGTIEFNTSSEGTTFELALPYRSVTSQEPVA